MLFLFFFLKTFLDLHLYNKCHNKIHKFHYIVFIIGHILIQHLLILFFFNFFDSKKFI
jgi:hypothetical protein